MIDNLCRKNVWLFYWCYMHKHNDKLVDHLLIHYPILQNCGLWYWVYLMFVG